MATCQMELHKQEMMHMMKKSNNVKARAYIPTDLGSDSPFTRDLVEKSFALFRTKFHPRLKLVNESCITDP